MVFFIVILATGAPALIVVAKLLVFLLAVASSSLTQVFGVWLRLLVLTSLLAASATVSFIVTPRLIPLLPDFREQGDGGVGLAYNALSIGGLYAGLAIATLSLSVFVIVLLVPHRDADVVDPLERSSKQDHVGS